MGHRTRLAALAVAALMVVGPGVALAQDAASDTKVASVAGGPHPFFDPWGPGTDAAVTDFSLAGGTYEFPPQWELTAQNDLVETLVAQGYNAFTIFPGDANATNTLMDELLANGIPSVAAGGCTTEPSPAIFCLATDVGNSAYIGTKTLIEAMGDQCTVEDPCQIVHIASRLVDPNTVARIAAVNKATAETGGTVKVMQHLTDSDDQEAATEKVGGILAANGPDIDGMVSVAYVGSSVAATLLKNIGDGRIKFVGIDDDQAVLDGIRDGYVVGTMSQNPYGQAYIGAWVLDQVRQGCTRKADAPWFLDTGTFLIDQSNLETYQDQRVQITQDLLSTFKDKYLDCPAG